MDGIWFDVWECLILQFETHLCRREGWWCVFVMWCYPGIMNSHSGLLANLTFVRGFKFSSFEN